VGTFCGREEHNAHGEGERAGGKKRPKWVVLEKGEKKQRMRALGVRPASAIGRSDGLQRKKKGDVGVPKRGRPKVDSGRNTILTKKKTHHRKEKTQTEQKEGNHHTE